MLFIYLLLGFISFCFLSAHSHLSPSRLIFKSRTQQTSARCWMYEEVSLRFCTGFSFSLLLMSLSLLLKIPFRVFKNFGSLEKNGATFQKFLNIMWFCTKSPFSAFIWKWIRLLYTSYAVTNMSTGAVLEDLQQHICLH